MTDDEARALLASLSGEEARGFLALAKLGREMIRECYLDDEEEHPSGWSVRDEAVEAGVLTGMHSPQITPAAHSAIAKLRKETP